MQAVVVQNGRVQLRDDAPAPVLNPADVLVDVHLAGVCETDLQLIQGYMGFEGTLGHEFVGVPTSGPLAGKRVVGEINCPCGACSACAVGLGNHCPNRGVIGILNRDGAFANSLSIPNDNLHAVPDSVTTDEAVFTEPLAAAFQILEQVHLTSHQSVIVLGDGRLGLLSAQVIARVAGAQVVLVGKHESKLAVGRELGLSCVPLTEIVSLSKADCVVDCTGSADGINSALQVIKPRGTLVLKTTVAGRQDLQLAPVVIDEITVVGSRCGPFGRALIALEQHTVDVKTLITARYPLAQAELALEHARSRDALKVLIDIRADTTDGS